MLREGVIKKNSLPFLLYIFLHPLCSHAAARVVKDPNAKAKSSAKKPKAPSGATSSTAKPKRSAAKSIVKKRKTVVKPESDDEEEEQEGEEEASVAPTPKVSRRKAKTKARR